MPDRTPPPFIYPSPDVEVLNQSLLTVIDALRAIYPELNALQAGLDKVAPPGRPEAAIVHYMGDWVSGNTYYRGDLVDDTTGDFYIADRTTTETPGMAAADWRYVGA